MMGDNLLKLPEAISLARRTVASMRQNIAIDLITVSLLMLGVLLGGVTMAVGMLVLVVILNAMRLLRRKHDHDTSTAPAQAPTGVRPLLLLPG
jgi:Cd2+/Zn2+-exporting ATPase